jgi:hypothetical protein
LQSIEGGDTTNYDPDLPRLDPPASSEASLLSLPPHIPSHLQNEASFSAQDYVSSAASSPSAAYAGLSIESERGGDMSGSEGGVGDSQDKRSQSPNRSPNRSFAHRAIMGGAADLPQRSSSPMKRRASDFEQDESTHHNEDVEMEVAPKEDSKISPSALQHVTVQEGDLEGSDSPEDMESDTEDNIPTSKAAPASSDAPKPHLPAEGMCTCGTKYLLSWANMDTRYAFNRRADQACHSDVRGSSIFGFNSRRNGLFDLE